MNELVQAVRRSLEKAALLTPQARLLCAVSGGADSMALLFALCRLRREVPFALHACHVQHGLRGEASQEDERFVRRWCAQLDVPLHVENAALSGGMDDPGAETRARDCRRAIFLAQMNALHMDAVLTAHHRDDQTETVLMHLLRGAGTEGLCGMRPCSVFGSGWLLRPFLSLPHARLAQALESEGLPHREDESNARCITPRNALRLNVLPQLEGLFPGASAHIAGAAEALAVDDQWLTQQADALYEQAVFRDAPLFLLHRQQLRDADEAPVRRVLRRWWREGLALCGLEPGERGLSRQDTLALYALTKAPSGSVCNLPHGLMAAAGPEHLHLLRQDGRPLQPAAAYEIPVLREQAVYHLPCLTLTRTDDRSVPCSSDAVMLTPQVLALHPVLRPPRAADRIHPLGAPGSKPLRRFLTDRKIDPVLRPALTVLAVGEDVLWIPSICTAEALRIASVPDGSVRLQGAFSFLPHRP